MSQRTPERKWMRKLREEVARVERLPKAYTDPFTVEWLSRSRHLLANPPKPHPPRLRGQTEADAPEPAPTERSAGSRDAQARERDEVAGAVGQEDTPSE
jgi:hypothetical protein